MKINVSEKGGIEITKVFNSITLKTDKGEELSICMRDSGFEFKYQEDMYFAKQGEVSPFHKSTRGNYLTEQLPIDEVTVFDAK